MHLERVYCINDHRSSRLAGFSDADWAGSHSDMRSTFGYCTLVGDNLVMCRSKKQTFVARSSPSSVLWLTQPLR